MSEAPRPPRRIKKRCILFVIVAGLAAAGGWLLFSPPSIPAGTVLVLELSEPPPERSLGGISALFHRESLDVFGLWQALRAAANDPKVDGLLVRIRPGSVRPGTVDELRELIGRFRESGKLTVAHVSAPDTFAYLLATAASEVLLDRSTTLDAVGVSLSSYFLKDALAEWGIEADFLRVGAQKGAYEELTMAGPTPELDASLNDLADSLYSSVVEQVAQARKLEAGVVRALFDRSPLRCDEAVAARLVDGLTSGGDESGHLQERTKRTVHLVTLNEYSSTVRPEKSAQSLALVHILGAIVEGETRELPFVGPSRGSSTVVRAIEDAAGDPSVAGILLRIDSPGGVASAAEKIHLAVLEARKVKPVVASLGGSAASGGYYAACGAEQILAHPTTLTGSIGIFGGKIVVAELLARHKLEVRTYARGQHAAMMDFTRRYTEEERMRLKGILEEAYRRFVDSVAVSRKRSFEQVDSVAQGRVWTGKGALGVGLVDAMGGLEASLIQLKSLARIDPARSVKTILLPPRPTFWDSLTGSRGSSGILPLGEQGLDAAGLQVVKDLDSLRGAGLLSGASQLALMPCAMEAR